MRAWGMAMCLEYQSVYGIRSRGIKRWSATVAACMLLLVALGVKVGIKANLIQVGYDLAHERERAVELDMRRRELEMELSVLRRPDRVASEARERLRLESARPGQRVKVIY